MKNKHSRKSLEKNVNSNNQNKTQFCTIRVGENLFNRISKHIATIKKCKESRYSRSNWINEAIKSKLLKEIKDDIITVDKFINTRIEVELIAKIEQQVSIMKKFNHSYSKQKWMLEALLEKLEEGEQSAKTHLKELIVASKKKLKSFNQALSKNQ